MKNITMKQNSPGMIMYGLITQIVITTEMDLNMPAMNIKKKMGNSISKVITSLEKRVRILPVGFESKNTICDLKTRLTIALCKFVTLARSNLKMINDLPNEARLNKRISPVNIRG